jgi:hypothetical protein
MELRRVDAKSVEVTLKRYLKQMRERLEQAASVAKAGRSPRRSWECGKGIEIALDIEQLIYEVNTFFNAAGSITRIGKT